MKTKIIAITLVLSLMIMGVAYAGWTEKNQVDADIHTGELNVDVECVTKLQKLDQNSELIWWNEQGNYNPNHLRFIVRNFYPGAEYEATVRFRNKGTITADIDYSSFVSNLPAGYYSLYVRDLSNRNLSSNTLSVAPGACAYVKIKVKTSKNTPLAEKANYYNLDVKFDISQFNVD